MPLRPTTVSEAVQGFKAYLVRRRRSPLTLKRYGLVLVDFERWAGDRSPGSIRTVEIDAGYLADWEERDRRLANALAELGDERRRLFKILSKLAPR